MSKQYAEVSGKEAPVGDGGPVDALIDFYRAFNARLLDDLAKNWAPDEVPSMSNPVGGIRRGWPSIRQGYEKLFGGDARIHVTFHDFVSHGDDQHYMFAGRERGVVETPEGRIEVKVRTTRWFAKIDGAWRQLHHHGSIEDPAMLSTYQTVLLGAPIVS